MDFMSAMKNTLNESEINVSYTENGAKGYKTTGKELLDMNFKIPSMRKMDETEIEKMFIRAWGDDPRLATLWAFYAGDVRGGLGERRLFRILEQSIASLNDELAIKLLKFVPEYTRWDNVFALYHRRGTHEAVVELIKDQLTEDMNNMANGKPISLLAKWMPSINTSSEDTRKLARSVSQDLGLTPRQYRKLMSKLRDYLKVIEVKMSAGEWSDIDYSAVPGMANLKYKDAFLRNDEDRRRAYLESLSKGETKINASVVYPCDIVHKYTGGRYVVESTDAALEGMWKALPDYVKGASNTIVVADGSGSMMSGGGTSVAPLDVANSLAIYFSERSSGPYKNKYITFSMRPQYVNFPENATLREKLKIAAVHDECANTNIEAVFTLILETAINNKVKPEDIPNILVVSDMEFDSCASANIANTTDRYYSWNQETPTPRLFKALETLYARYGYKLPKMAFWNVASRTNTIPVRENELGVTLVSGYSATICEMGLSNKTDPFEILRDKLESERYAPVNEVVSSVLK